MDLLALILALCACLVLGPALVIAYFHRLSLIAHQTRQDLVIEHLVEQVKGLASRTPDTDKIANLEQKMAGVMLRLK